MPSTRWFASAVRKHLPRSTISRGPAIAHSEESSRRSARSELRMEQRNAEELVRRLAAALRATELYAPNHPLIQRSIDALSAAATSGLQLAPSMVVAFIGDDIVVNATRL